MRRVKKNHWEVELFGTGKQVAMPPSIHPDTGAEYAWGREFDLDEVEIGMGPVIPSTVIEGFAAIQNEDDGAVDERPPLGLTLEGAQGYLDSLPLDEWCEDRDGWYQVGMALHHEFAGRGLGGEAFEMWCQFSAQSDKFDINNAHTVWNSFKDQKSKNIRMATIVQAARHARSLERFDDVDFDDDCFGTDEESVSLGAAPGQPDAATDDLDDLLGDGKGEHVAPVDEDDLDDLSETAKKKYSLDWMKGLEYSDDGGIKNTFANVQLVIENDIRTFGLFERNRLLNGDVFRKGPATFKKKREPEGGTFQITGPAWEVQNKVMGELVLDVHVAMVRQMLSAAGRRGGWGLSKPASTDVREAIEIVARRNAFHPIRDFLDGLKWDGTERVDTLFVDYLGTDDDSYHRKTARLTRIGAVT
ncbi:MAG: PriCT-2 domain-containing protein, partial [Erythrobacter sp.]|nr:PriCT-2 domain-containing protein [Erythrobacter sp.]